MVALDAGVVRPDDIFYGEKGKFVYAGQSMYDHNYRKGGIPILRLLRLYGIRPILVSPKLY